MERVYTLNDYEIGQLKTAVDAIRRIDCRSVICTDCPLCIEDGCIVNRLYSVIRKAEHVKEN